MNHSLLIEMQRFAIGKNAYHREEQTEGNILSTLLEKSLKQTFLVTQQLIKCGLKLLEELPVIRDSIFDYFSLIFEVAIGNHIKNEVKVFNNKNKIIIKIINRKSNNIYNYWMTSHC